MNIGIVILVSGFLFLFILILYLAILPVLGYVIGMGDYDSDAELQKIIKDPKKFKVTIVLALIHDVCVIILALMLFIAFSQYNVILGIVWTIFRTGEGVVLIYNEKSYWELLSVARQSSAINVAEKRSLGDLGNHILETRNSRFSFGMILWSLGTLAFSIVLVTSGVVPPLIGWLGIVASIIVGSYNGIFLVNNTDYKILAAGGLLAIFFEVIIGGWLILYGFSFL